jgi:molybdate transport system substrate-binding protein
MNGKRGLQNSRLNACLYLCTLFALLLFTAACDNKERSKEILVASAASLQPVMNELKEIYEARNQNNRISFTFAGSGTLEQQIKEGAPMDLFLSASVKQMDSLEEGDYLLPNTYINLLENEIVLIKGKRSTLELSGFEDILSASVIAIGNPESVPVGQYAKEVFTYLGIWNEVSAKATLGKDVTEVLSWVSSGNADAGVVYRTDAVSNAGVEIIAAAPKDSHSRVLYTAAVIRASKLQKEAKHFLEFLTTEEAKRVFLSYGFQPIDE